MTKVSGIPVPSVLQKRSDRKAGMTKKERTIGIKKYTNAVVLGDLRTEDAYGSMTLVRNTAKTIKETVPTRPRITGGINVNMGEFAQNPFI